MEKIRNFRDLKVWQISIDMVTLVYQMLKSFQKEEQYGIMSQIRRSAVSVPANIAEGQARHGTKEFIQFLYIAEGSLFEVLTLTEIFKRRKLIKDHGAKEIRSQAEIIDRKLRGLINSLRGRF